LIWRRIELELTTFSRAATSILNRYGGTGVYLSFFLVTVAGLIISAVMLRSNIFSKVTAYMAQIQLTSATLMVEKRGKL
jgi:hypothetical protein